MYLQDMPSLNPEESLPVRAPSKNIHGSFLCLNVARWS